MKFFLRAISLAGDLPAVANIIEDKDTVSWWEVMGVCFTEKHSLVEVKIIPMVELIPEIKFILPTQNQPQE